MLQRWGYVSKASVGAFQNDELVGFVLNGIRDWDGLTFNCHAMGMRF
jgi:hypothetical protein